MRKLYDEEELSRALEGTHANSCGGKCNDKIKAFITRAVIAGQREVLEKVRPTRIIERDGLCGDAWRSKHKEINDKINSLLTELDEIEKEEMK